MESVELQAAAGELLSLAGKILKTARYDTEQRLAACNVGISALQYGILSKLNGKNYTLSELSGLMSREPATLLPAVDALEAHQLLERGQDVRDRRRTPLAITRRGLAVLQQVPPVAENGLLMNALKEMGDQKVEQLLALLQQVALLVAPDPKEALESHKDEAG